MPARKKTVRRARSTRPAVARRAATRLERTLKDTRKALTSAETTVEKQVRGLIKRTGVDTKKATTALRDWNARLERERKKAVKQIEGRVAEWQARAKKERRVIGRRVEEAVQNALAALNIPSRDEVHELTRKVEELSHRIERFRR